MKSEVLGKRLKMPWLKVVVCVCAGVVTCDRFSLTVPENMLFLGYNALKDNKRQMSYTFNQTCSPSFSS